MNGKKGEPEEVYVAVRILEATAKSDGSTAVEATVYARVAERVNSGGLGGSEVESLLDGIESEMSEREKMSGGGRAVGTVRRAIEEVREEGKAEIVDEVDDAVVARLRSEFDGSG